MKGYIHKQLPESWRWVKLGDIGTFDSGGTPAKSEPKFWGGSIPFVTGADITEIYITAKNARAFLTEEGLNSGKTAICKPGTVLFVTRTRVGRAGIAQELMGASQDLSPFTCGSGVLPEFVCKYLLNISDYLIDSCRGSTIQGLTRDFIGKLYIPLPPLPEQKRIIGLLLEQMASVEKARKAAEAQLDAAKALPASLLRKVFKADKAKNWPRYVVGEVCERIDYGYTARADFSISSPKYLRITDIQNGGVQWNKVPGCKIEASEEKANMLDDGDIVFARTGATTGKSFLLKNPPRAVFASYLIRLRANQNKILPNYLYIYFQSDGYWQQIASRARGGAQPNVNASLLAKLQLPVPPLIIQKELSDMLDEENHKLDMAYQAMQFELDAIKLLPSALLRKAFNGEL